MTIGYIGLGKMGINMVSRLIEKQHDIHAWNRSEAPRQEAEKIGAKTYKSVKDLVKALPSPKIVWIMVTHNAVDDVISKIVSDLSQGDIVIDGGNSFYKDSVRRGEFLSKKGIRFLDIGVSGGPGGARNGACLMIGGDKTAFDEMKQVFIDISADNAYAYLGLAGAGHFAKMVHNGIEYGMMQAIAEGFEVIKKSQFKYPLAEVARIYNTQSVITSRLTEWLYNGFKKYGENLESISSTVAHTGEGEWTVKTAEELKVPVPVIKDSFDFRVASKDNPSFTGKVLSMLRNMFGGHSIS